MGGAGCVRPVLSAAAIASAVVAGCAAPGSSFEADPAVVSTATGTALHSPVWSYREHALVALTDDHRLVTVTDPEGSRRPVTRTSAPLGAGRDIEISELDDRHVFVPQPGAGRVAVVDLDGLRPVGALTAGPAPAYLAQDAGARLLLALSADGTHVTAVNLHRRTALATAEVPGDAQSTIDGANRGDVVEYHLYGPGEIGYYKGAGSPPPLRGTYAVTAEAAAGDGAKVTRTYVAGPGSRELLAVDVQRGGDGLQVVGHAVLPAPIRFLGTDDTRIYAATDRGLVVLQSASFTGYRNSTIPVIRTISLADRLGGAAVSGMAIGPHRVYLTVRGQDRVLGVAKPRL
ncbi:hypothetical protein [Speluncibacter jeojiensis]|uniref:Uncharacterized protein n=1 Tax=Speluncibacter jeojiensis TaxID=2710754 RepID=A0A9X4RCP8_9ACTN|nr:hypothetical protein [Corynebacteriales bacterium D3-21]